MKYANFFLFVLQCIQRENVHNSNIKMDAKRYKSLVMVYFQGLNACKLTKGRDYCDDFSKWRSFQQDRLFLMIFSRIEIIVMIFPSGDPSNGIDYF